MLVRSLVNSHYDCPFNSLLCDRAFSDEIIPNEQALCTVGCLHVFIVISIGIDSAISLFRDTLRFPMGGPVYHIASPAVPFWIQDHAPPSLSSNASILVSAIYLLADEHDLRRHEDHLEEGRGRSHCAAVSSHVNRIGIALQSRHALKFAVAVNQP